MYDHSKSSLMQYVLHLVNKFFTILRRDTVLYLDVHGEMAATRMIFLILLPVIIK
jgi:hypothetical protein